MILDSGAGIAIARGDRRVAAFVQRAIDQETEVTIPVVVPAETMRGGPGDAPIHRSIKAIGTSHPTSASVGRRAGELLSGARRSDTVDAMVVAEAATSVGGHILSSDVDDLTVLARGLDLVIHRV